MWLARAFLGSFSNLLISNLNRSFCLVVSMNNSRTDKFILMEFFIGKIS